MIAVAGILREKDARLIVIQTHFWRRL